MSTEWFKLNEEKFNLYKVINDTLGIKTAVHTSYYFDYALLFNGILSYFGEYVTFENYQKYSLEEHTEYFNTYC
ncbi:hypothetical protein D3C78_1577050 [compost metagenome]